MTKLELLNEFKETLKRSEERLASFKRQLASYDNCLVSHQWVAKVGMYTVGKDENRMLKLRTLTLPSLWTEAGIKEIMDIQKKKSIFRNFLYEPMKVEKVFFRDYYRDEIKREENFITSQRQILERMEAN